MTDGASIPRAFWTLVGGPFEGEYRDAALVHDQYCQRHDGRKWQEVHKMFYGAMRAAGVSAAKAELLYTAVRIGAPRWPPNPYLGMSPVLAAMADLWVDKDAPELTQRDADKIREFVGDGQKSLQELDSYVAANYPPRRSQ